MVPETSEESRKESRSGHSWGFSEYFAFSRPARQEKFSYHDIFEDLSVGHFARK